MAKDKKTKVEDQAEVTEEVTEAEVKADQVDALDGVDVPVADTVEEAEAEVVEEKEPTVEELLASKDAQITELNNKVLRNMAEFDNFRKRTIKEKSSMYESGAKEVLEKLLPVVDNFERAFDAATDEHKDDPFVKGIDMIYKQVMAMLDDLDVVEIEAKDQPFDPDLHHAVQHEDSDEHDESVVVDVYQKGYMYKDSVLRYSMVKVVN